MKVAFYSIESKTETWVEEAKAAYQKKLKPFFSFELETIKSPPLDRDDAPIKKKREAEKILKILRPGDHLILFDEGGKIFSKSEDFAAAFGRRLETSPARVVFLIGGAFGVDASVKSKAGDLWSLSGLTLNHWVAQVVALEQIYRAMTILKRIPYHNR